MCDCLSKIDANLAEHNGRLAVALTLSKDLKIIGARLLIATEKIDKAKRKRLPAVMASFCPFCGASLLTPNANVTGLAPERDKAK